MGQADPQDFVEGAYSRVNALWSATHHQLATGDCGFSILSGPPQFQPKLMIIGSNPGHNSSDVGTMAHVEKSRPDKTYIPTANWLLANRLRILFDRAEARELLDGAIQTNMLFFKSNSLDKDKPRAWSDNDPTLRASIEASCADEARRLIRMSEPRTILVLGLGTFRRHADPTGRSIVQKGRKNRCLIIRGCFHGSPAIGIPHLTGSRIAAEDIDLITEWLRDHFAE